MFDAVAMQQNKPGRTTKQNKPGRTTRRREPEKTQTPGLCRGKLTLGLTGDDADIDRRSFSRPTRSFRDFSSPPVAPAFAPSTPISLLSSRPHQALPLPLPLPSPTVSSSSLPDSASPSVVWPSSLLLLPSATSLRRQQCHGGRGEVPEHEHEEYEEHEEHEDHEEHAGRGLNRNTQNCPRMHGGILNSART